MVIDWDKELTKMQKELEPQNPQACDLMFAPYDIVVMNILSYSGQSIIKMIIPAFRN